MDGYNYGHGYNHGPRHDHGFNRPYNPGNFMEPTVTGKSRWGEVYPGVPGNPGGHQQKHGRGGLGWGFSFFASVHIEVILY